MKRYSVQTGKNIHYYYAFVCVIQEHTRTSYSWLVQLVDLKRVTFYILIPLSPSLPHLLQLTCSTSCM